MQSLTRTLLESSYNFIIMLLIHTDEDIIIMLCQGFSEKKILSLLSNQLRQIFDDLYWARIMVKDKLVSSTVDETSIIIWDMLQSHEVMADFSKHDIKR